LLNGSAERRSRDYRMVKVGNAPAPAAMTTAAPCTMTTAAAGFGGVSVGLEGFGAFEGALPHYKENEFPNWYGTELGLLQRLRSAAW